MLLTLSATMPDATDLGFLLHKHGAGNPRFRLVYRYTPTEVAAVAVETVAVGSRADLDAYRRAIANLGRPAS